MWIRARASSSIAYGTVLIHGSGSGISSARIASSKAPRSISVWASTARAEGWYISQPSVASAARTSASDSARRPA